MFCPTSFRSIFANDAATPNFGKLIFDGRPQSTLEAIENLGLEAVAISITNLNKIDVKLQRIE